MGFPYGLVLMGEFNSDDHYIYTHTHTHTHTHITVGKNPLEEME